MNDKKQKRNLLNLTLLYTAGSFSTRILSFLLVFVITFFLSKDDVGYYDLILTTVSLILPLTTLQLSDAVLRWSLDDDSKENVTKVFTNSILLVCICLSIFGVITILSNLFFDIKYIWTIFILIVVQSIYLIVKQTLRGIGLNKLFVLSDIIFSIIYVTLVVIFLYQGMNIEGLLYGNIIAFAITLLFLIINKKMYTFFDWNKRDCNTSKEIVHYSLPLIPNNLSWWAISSANRYIILYYLGAAANGIFAISYKLPVILMIFTNIFYMAWQEKAIVSYDNENRDSYYSSIFEKYTRLLLSISIILIALSKPMLKYLVAPDFFESWKYIPILLLCIIFNALSGFYGTGYLSTKKTKGTLTSSVIGGIVTIIFSFLLIPKFELYGASISILIGYIVILGIRIRHMRDIFNITIPKKKLLIELGVYIVVSSIMFLDNKIFLLLNIIIAIICVIWINLSDIIKIWKNRNTLINKFRRK